MCCRLGAVFTVIQNTSTDAIAGTFSNLPDGSMITVGSNTFQADYEGGDGNDLTLTVVPY
jgi:fibronectin-binding autotransporter adhesin